MSLRNSCSLLQLVDYVPLFRSLHFSSQLSHSHGVYNVGSAAATAASACLPEEKHLGASHTCRQKMLCCKLFRALHTRGIAGRFLSAGSILLQTVPRRARAHTWAHRCPQGTRRNAQTTGTGSCHLAWQSASRILPPRPHTNRLTSTALHTRLTTARAYSTSADASNFIRHWSEAWQQAWHQPWPEIPWSRFAWLVNESSGYIQISIINALNLVGNQLPKMMAVFSAEILRNWTGDTRSEGFELLPPLGDTPLGGTGWLTSARAAAESLLDAAASLARMLMLWLLFAPVVLSAPLALALDLKRAEWMELLRRTLEAAGPAFIKWGQWAATRHDIFPPDLCSELELLHTHAPGHKFWHTRLTVESAFGLPLEVLFLDIEQDPVASGSIGQIHRAVLSDTGAAVTGYPAGTVVAVKVRHPGVGNAILRDFRTMMWVAHVAAALPGLQNLRLEETLKQFAAPLREQVDLSWEGFNLRRFGHNFRKTPSVRFPVPLYPLVSPDVLVETFEGGQHIAHYLQQAPGSPDALYNTRLAELGCGAMLQMMLVDNLIHSDLHPGNILVRLEPPQGVILRAAYSAAEAGAAALPSGSPLGSALAARAAAWLQPRLVLLDVGMATALQGDDQANMFGLFKSFAALDGEECGKWTLRFSGDQQTCPDPGAFVAAMGAAFTDLRESGDWSDTRFDSGAAALAAVLEIVRQYQVSLPGHICAVVVTTLILEGWSHKLDPDHSVLSQVKTMFEPQNFAWRDRVGHVVDSMIEQEGNQMMIM